MLESATGRSVPFADGGQNRKRPFAGNVENGSAAIRYALVIFFY